ncbi:flippase [Marinomonas sp. 2405UD66-6]|uniref:flippase n=1 Tax=Marinomonas sp. 2405UD66-6 TaxID=3391834 RepID=UPI0039C9303D
MCKQRKQLLTGSIGSLLVNVVRAGLSFVLAVVLARFMGPSEYGSYSFAFAILMLVAIPAQVGVPQLIVRETAKAQASQDWALMRGLWRWGNLAVMGFSALGFLFAIVITVLLMQLEDNVGRLAIIVTGVALIPLMALTVVQGACLRGLRRVVIGQLPDAFLRPIILLGMVCGYFFTSELNVSYSAELVMGMHVIAVACSLIIVSLILSKLKPKELGFVTKLHYESAVWRKAIIPLAMITGLHLINNYADLIILGVFSLDEEVGIYRAVSQIALLVVFGLQAINQVLHPYFARMYKLNEMQKLQRLVTLSARGILILSLPPALILMFFGGPFMEWVFGYQYESGSLALSILVIGQLINAAFGSVSALLNMTGHEHDTVRGLGISILVNVLLNFLLIPQWGMEGAAIATSTSLVIWNFILHKAVQKRLSIESSALGYSKRKFL